MYLSFSQEPTILLGLGGCGCRIVGSLAERDLCIPDVIPYCLDTDCHDMDQNIPPLRRLHRHVIHFSGILGQILDELPGDKDWFPSQPQLPHMTIRMGCHMTRAVGRAAFEYARLHPEFRPLRQEILRLAQCAQSMRSGLRVIIVTSLAGGFGAGSFIQLAAWIRSLMAKEYPYIPLRMFGEFILPSLFDHPERVRMDLIERMYANGYAALKELINIDSICAQQTADSKDAVFPHGAPFDYCFLHSHRAQNPDDAMPVFARSIKERYFSPRLNSFYTQQVVQASTVFSLVQTDTLPVGADLNSSPIISSLEQAEPVPCQQQLFLLNGPWSQQTHIPGSPPNTAILPQIDGDEPEPTVIHIRYGVDLAKAAPLRRGSGKYYLHYRNALQNPQIPSPHLDVRWATGMQDIE